MNDPTFRRIEWRFVILFAALVLQVVVQPMAFGDQLAPIWYDFSMAVVVLVVLLSFCYKRHERWLALSLGIPTLCCAVGSHFVVEHARQHALLLRDLCAVIFLFAAVMLIVKTIFQQRRITADGIVGAVCGYLLLGIGWAVLYTVVETWWQGSFSAATGPLPVLGDGRPRIEIFIYYSFVTLTTVGFGDMWPVTPQARTCSWVEALSGQFYMAVIVAGLVGAFIAKASNQLLPHERIHKDV